MFNNRIINFSLTTAAAEPPVTLNEFKEHLQIDVNDTGDDVVMQSALDAAILMCENYTNKQFVSALFKGYADGFSQNMFIFKNPVTEISSIKYYDKNNQLIALTADEDYFIDLISSPCRITMLHLPSVKDKKPNAVEIEFKAGYADAAAVPEPIKMAIKLQATNHYEYREDAGRKPELVQVSKLILNSYKDFYL